MIATIDDVKKYWDDRPCNVRHSKKDIGSLEYFDEVEKKRYTAEPHIPEFADFSSWKGKKVLEIGCGLATEGINFARHGADYTGTDLSIESLNLAKKRFEVYNQKGRFFQGNAENLSSFVGVEKYDLIYSFGVIHHSPNPNRIIDQIYKYMDDSTILKIMLYAKNSWKNYMIESELDQPEAQYGCPIANTFSKEEVGELLHGLEILSIEQTHIFPYQIEPYKQGKFIKEPWFESMPDKMFNTLKRKLGWHLLITSRRQK
tara:strand:- start:539 stop:1315 length:777 start_codon:yes stop_codon:yes gene_type:complete